MKKAYFIFLCCALCLIEGVYAFEEEINYWIEGPTVVYVGDGATYTAYKEDSNGESISIGSWGYTGPAVSAGADESSYQWFEEFLAPGDLTLYHYPGDVTNEVIEFHAVVQYYGEQPQLDITTSSSGLLSLEVVNENASTYYDSFRWFQVSDSGAETELTGETGYNLVDPEEGIYYVRGVKDGYEHPSLKTRFYTSSQIIDQNYSIEYTSKVTGIKTFASLVNGSVSNRSEDISYYDGLGRIKQQVNVSQSPAGESIIKPFDYDEYGRQQFDYLPYVLEGNDGAFDPYAISEGEGFTLGSSEKFYQEQFGVEDGHFAYAQSVFESSPLNRVVQSYSPGNSWAAMGGNKPTYQYYEVNTENEVDSYLLNSQGNIEQSLYAAGELYKTVRKDENGNENYEFTDKRGRVVCKKSIIPAARSAKTYYIYDDKDQLRMVIPPEAMDVARGDEEETFNVSSFRDLWFFMYNYDDRGRMIAKKVPGAEWVYMVYDARDRLVLSQDGNQRDADFELITGDESINVYNSGTNYYIENSGSLTLLPGFHASGPFVATTDPASVTSSVWTFTKYDVLNRPVMTGLVDISGDQETVQELVDDFYASGTNPMYETPSGAFHSYTNVSYPTNIGLNTVLTVTYYDDYDFTSETPPDGYNSLVKGQVTGSKKRILGSTDFLEQVTFYDNKYRVIKTKDTNHLGGEEVVVNTYSYLSNHPTHTEHTHTVSGGSNVVLTDDYTYDHMFRLLTRTSSVDENLVSSSSSTITHGYDELGQLQEKSLGDIQHLDYKYNIRGWLTHINNGVDFDDQTDKFGMELLYADAGQYNGNIGQVNWKSLAPTGINAGQSYEFQYDGLNRLIKAMYSSNDDYLDGYFNVQGNTDTNGGILYDYNGNIQTLKRNHFNELKDDLTYNYRGNQLVSVSDDGNEWGFDESNSEGADTDEYLYDSNGNMISDLNKGISYISYNYLNLPDKVVTAEGTIHYTYDATGVKLRKFYDKSSGVDETTDYIAGIHYVNNSLKFVRQPEGRYSFVNDRFEYDLKDHLGNVRVTVATSLSEVNDVFDFEGSSSGLEADAGSSSTAYAYSGDKSWELIEDFDLVYYPVGAGAVISVEVQTLKESGGTAELWIIYNPSSGGSTWLSNISNTADDYTWQKLQATHTLPEAGSVSVYINSSDNGSGFFDDLKITIANTALSVIQRDDYYPFGLTFNSYKSGSDNKYLYNGKEKQDETGWYHYGARMYDPAVARWNHVDPLGDLYYSWSPYNYTLNNPIKNLDPDGRIVGTVVGAVVGGVAGAVDAYVNDKDMASSIAEGAIAGAVAGAVVDLTVATGGGAAVVFGGAVAGGALGGAVGDVVGQTTDYMRNCNASFGEAISNVDGSQVASKAVTGAVAGAAGGALGAGAGKLMQGASNVIKEGMKQTGKTITSTAQTVMQQGVTKSTVNGVTTYSQAPGLAKTVQGVMNNMTKGMGESGKRAANALVVTEVVTTGATETATKTQPVQSTADYVKETVSDWFDW